MPLIAVNLEVKRNLINKCDKCVPSNYVSVLPWQVWDYDLERSAEHWAHSCRWEHGPSHMLTQIGQNLGAHWGRCVFKSMFEIQLLSQFANNSNLLTCQLQ